MARTTKADRADFARYLRQCSDAQVLGVWRRERDAGRRAYAALAELEAARRGPALEAGPDASRRAPARG